MLRKALKIKIHHFLEFINKFKVSIVRKSACVVNYFHSSRSMLGWIFFGKLAFCAFDRFLL